VNGGGFNLMAGEEFAPGIVALVSPMAALSRSLTASRFPTAWS